MGDKNVNSDGPHKPAGSERLRGPAGLSPSGVRSETTATSAQSSVASRPQHSRASPPAETNTEQTSASAFKESGRHGGEWELVEVYRDGVQAWVAAGAERRRANLRDGGRASPEERRVCVYRVRV